MTTRLQFPVGCVPSLVERYSSTETAIHCVVHRSTLSKQRNATHSLYRNIKTNMSKIDPKVDKTLQRYALWLVGYCFWLDTVVYIVEITFDRHLYLQNNIYIFDNNIDI